jgi:aminoglycoside phosphotransferase family enzyme/predicted kinase
MIEGLRNAVCYPHPVWDIRILETHISWVLLTGEIAYKIKKPVDFGFLDFSTLEKRQHCCNEELRLNRRLAASIYVDVVAITGIADRPRVGGAGDVIEYAVKMWQFDGTQMAEQLAARGELTPELLDGLALEIASFHQQVCRSDQGLPHGGALAARRAVEENLETVIGRCGNERSANVQVIQRWAGAEWEKMQALMDTRKAQGWVRECHGDLHLGNLVLWNDRLTAFDGIEFNEDLRWIDVISEIAFLVMDLEVHGLKPLAWRFLNAYVGHTGDYEGLRLLRFFLVYRAMVRAKIALLSRSQASDQETSDRCLRLFSSYLAYGRQAIEVAPPLLIITLGLSGSGKSTLAQGVAERLPAIRIRSDVERKRLAALEGLEPAKLYDPATTERTYGQLRASAAAILSSGISVVIDATFIQRRWRAVMAELADELGVAWVILRVDAPVEVLKQRIRLRAEMGADPSDADIAVLERQRTMLEELAADEEPRAARVDATLGFDFDAVIDCCRRIASGD